MSDLTLFDTVPPIHSTFGEDTPRARRDDPVTSHIAADSNDVHGARSAVLDAFHRRTYFADHQLVEFLASAPFTPQRVRTARAELSGRDVLVLADFTIPSPTGRPARVWTLAKDAA